MSKAPQTFTVKYQKIRKVIVIETIVTNVVASSAENAEEMVLNFRKRKGEVINSTTHASTDKAVVHVLKVTPVPSLFD